MKLDSNRIVFVVANRTDDLYDKYPINTFCWIPPQFPLGCGYLAAFLEQDGFEVIVMDNYLNKKPPINVAIDITSKNARYVGLSANTLTINNALDIAREVKNIDKRIITILGGPHASLFQERMIAEQDIDFVITGEGEYALRDLLRELRFTKGGPQKYSKHIIRVQRIDNLDLLPDPARHLFDFYSYNRTAEVMDERPADMICSSRGCPFSCTYCSSSLIWKRIYRKRSPSRVVNEIEFLNKNFGSKAIYFREDNFTVDKRHVEGICNALIERGITIPWECESRVDILSQSMLEKMARAGCKAIWFGVESGSPRILKQVKGISLEQVRSAFRWCKEVGIDTGAMFMLGFPNEKAEDIYQTKELALELEAKTTCFATYVGFPKSKLYTHCLENKLYEARYGDILIAKNENFSFEELLKLEKHLDKAIALKKYNKRVSSFVSFIKWVPHGIYSLVFKGQRWQRTLNFLKMLREIKSFDKGLLSKKRI